MNISKEVSFSSMLLSWYNQVKEPYLWRELWQVNKDPYPVWVSEIMLQQTTLSVVIPVFSRFIKKYPTPYDLAVTNEESLREAIRGLGYYRRFKFLHQGVKYLIEFNNHQWPANSQEWQKIPGIGPYTSAALASITNGEKIAAVDGNIERVMARIFGVENLFALKNFKDKIRALSFSLMENAHPGDYNQALMELGQKYCRPKSPLCEKCPVVSNCLAFDKKLHKTCPGDKPQQNKIAYPMTLVIYWNKSKNELLLFNRSEKEKFLKRTWGFFTAGNSTQTGCYNKIGTFGHNITKHKITAEVWVNILTNKDTIALLKNNLDVKAVPTDLLEPKLVSNLDRKALMLFYKEKGYGPQPTISKSKILKNSASHDSPLGAADLA